MIRSDHLNRIFGNADEDRDSSNYRWRPGADTTAMVGRLSGKVQFAADENTNSIIATANNKANYEVEGGQLFDYDHEDIGVIMEITPHINKNGDVVMTVSLETSQATGETRFGSDILQKREYDTQIAVRSGETMVMGGIRLTSQTETIRKIPLLGSIPYLGVLFRNRATVDSTTNLYAFITPSVVSDDERTQSITEEYEERVREGNVDQTEEREEPEG